MCVRGEGQVGRKGVPHGSGGWRAVGSFNIAGTTTTGVSETGDICIVHASAVSRLLREAPDATMQRAQPHVAPTSADCAQCWGEA